jgi:2-oxo-4-hydroxy-4-carboxy-5-ureidoimidazoline decarboxylase
MSDKARMTIAEVNALSDAAFVDQFGFLFEHTPWIVEATAGLRPFATVTDMFLTLIFVFDDAGPELQLDLVRAHPKLADKAAIAAGLTRESAAEQASAGLDALTPEEFARFHALNDAYEKRFGFPFIICVRRAGGKAGILAAMADRLDNPDITEFAMALQEVGKIVKLRLEDKVAA